MNKEETKDEILSKYEYDVHYYGGGRRHILEAMDEYAKQEAIRFTVFCASNFWYNDETELWESFTEGESFEVNGEQLIRFTTSELYSIYIHPKQK